MDACFANLVLKLKFIRYPDLVPDALKDTKDHSTCGPPPPLKKMVRNGHAGQ